MISALNLDFNVYIQLMALSPLGQIAREEIEERLHLCIESLQA